jgi:hypothetical protein
MALLLWNKLRRRCCGALQKSICQKAKLKQVFQRADEMVTAHLRRRGDSEIRPVCRNQRSTSVRQNQNEIQALLPDGVAENFQRPSFKRMMAARDGYTFRVFPEVGSLRWFPSITFRTNGW